MFEKQKLNFSWSALFDMKTRFCIFIVGHCQKNLVILEIHVGDYILYMLQTPNINFVV